MNKNKGAQMEAARQRKAERCPTRSYLDSWRVGQQVSTAEGERYVVIAAHDDDRRVLTIQKLVCDRAGRPLRGVRERELIHAIAGRDGVKFGGKWARRIPEGEACAV
jgi:hypothetical protein